MPEKKSSPPFSKFEPSKRYPMRFDLVAFQVWVRRLESVLGEVAVVARLQILIRDTKLSRTATQHRHHHHQPEPAFLSKNLFSSSSAASTSSSHTIFVQKTLVLGYRTIFFKIFGIISYFGVKQIVSVIWKEGIDR